MRGIRNGNSMHCHIPFSRKRQYMFLGLTRELK